MNTDQENPKYKSYIRLLTSNQARIYGFIHAMVPNHPVSDDIMQETSLFMWESFEKFEEGTNFAAWGISIARNMIMRYYRQQKRRGLTFDIEAIENLTGQSDVFKQSKEEQIAALRHCFKKLGSGEQNLLEMRYIQGDSVRVISEKINKTPGHLYRIMAKIHNLLLQCVNKQLAS